MPPMTSFPGSQTMLAPDRPPPLQGYKLQQPTESDAVAALHRVFGAERSAERWGTACRAAGLMPGMVLGPQRLEQVVKALATQGGATATVARSVEIRMRTYARLASQATLTAGGQR